MTTIINSSPAPEDNSYKIFFGIFILIVVGLVFIYFGIPALRQMGTPQINVPAPVINMPGEIDVNVQQTP